jgi:hypothetical protein
MSYTIDTLIGLYCANDHAGRMFEDAVPAVAWLNGNYIFASPRGSESQANIQTTFTLVAGNYSGSVPVTCACSPTQTSDLR